MSAQRPANSTVAPDKVLRAGAATSNITPPLGVSVSGGFQDRTARHIHDELHVRCLALDNGTTKLVLATIDTALIDRRLFDAAKRQVHEATGLPIGNMLMSATHAHSGGTLMPVGQSEPDPRYQAFVTQRIADGIRRALNNLEPARIGWGFGEVPQHVFNRRWHLMPGTVPPNPFGKASDRVSMNPGAGNPNLVRPAGPTDPQVWFISVQSLDRRPIAVYANYSLHYVGGVGPDHISADYFGAFSDRIQELLGADRQDPPFVEIGLELRRKHPNSFIVSLANAYHGYLPTRAQHELGGYETWRSRWACLEIDASEKIAVALDELFERLQ